MFAKMKDKLGKKWVITLCATAVAAIAVTATIALAGGGQADADEWDDLVNELGPAAFEGSDSDPTPAPVLDEGLRPSEPGQWGSPEDWLPEGYHQEPRPTAEEIDYYNEHWLDGIGYDDLFTDDGVVISALYMDWYIVKVMMERDPMLGLQSNPYVYLEGNEYYDAIIAMGPAAIPQLEQEMREPSSRGLSIYLIAVAVEKTAKADIEGIIDDHYAIGTAGDFWDYWVPVRASATQDVREIAYSSEYTTEQKLEKIGYYGLLAVPALDDLRNDPALSEALRVGLNARLESLGASDPEMIAYITECLA
jgi:hypothetical protein